MEVAHARAMEVTSSGSTKRRKLDSGDQLIQSSPPSTAQLENQCRCVMNSSKDSASLATSGTSNQIPASLCFSNEFVKDRSRSLDLKAENFGADISTSLNDGFSREATPLNELSSGYLNHLMESSKTRKHPSSASSCVAKMPLTAEIEEFFSGAEKYEQKRFADKYNYDIVKDVPLEGRYQWVCLKP